MGAAPRIAGFTPTEVKVLAALAKAPRGLASIRVLAARAGLSATATSNAFTALEPRGLVMREQAMVAAGRAKAVEVLRANPGSAQWPELDCSLAKTVPPEAPTTPAKRVPAHLRHLFWNTASSQMGTADSGPYIARRLIMEGDIEGLGWGVANLTRNDWLHAAGTRGISKPQQAMARNFAHKGEGVSKPPSEVAGLHIAGIPDIFAMKLKVIADRGELRDYFDLMAIEQQTGLGVEEGLGFFLTRFRRPPENQVLMPVLAALGYFDDVDEDDSLPLGKPEISAYWRRRQPEIARHMQRFGV